MTEQGIGITTIKYGRDYDHPWDTFAGTVDQRREQVAEAFGLTPDTDDARSKTLAELTIEAHIVATRLRHVAVTIGAKPVTTIKQPKGAPVAQEPEVGQPEDQTEDVASLIKNATTEDQLNDIWAKHKDKFNDEIIALFKAQREKVTNDG